MSESKKRAIWSRIFGVWNSRHHRVISILGIRIKIRSKYLMFRERLNDAEKANEQLKKQVQNLIQQQKQQSARMDRQIELLAQQTSRQDSQAELITQQSQRQDKQEKLHAELANKTEAVRRDVIARGANLERKIMYKVHKYCPDEKFPEVICDWYRERRQGRELNLSNPRTYNEKVQWSKVFDSTPIKTRLADKYLVRDWVEERIGSEYLIPLLGAWDSFDEIDFDSLPDRFVLKCNHGCAYNLIVKDKSKLDMEDARRKITMWMGENFAFKAGLELHYAAIPHKIIAEEFIENVGSGDGDLYDYKFWCFDGKVKYIQFLSERNTNGLKMAFYDLDWKKQEFVYSFPLDTKDMPRPDNLDEMIAVAEKLAAGFNHVRVDLYRMDDGKLYFGEMTFTSASGNCNWQPAEWDLKMGELMPLPEPTPFRR